MRSAPTLLLLLALAPGCRRNSPIDAPRGERRSTLDASVGAADAVTRDAPVDRPSRGLVATLMSCSPATRDGPRAPWVVSLRLTVRNQSASALPLRREGVVVSADEGTRADLSAPDAVEAPAEIAPRGRDTLIVRARFPPSNAPPISVTFAFDSVGGNNHPISFPIPSAR